jgi:hypothetical protein
MTWASRITDAGAANLKHCPQLEEVNLLGSNTGDGVIRALAGKQQIRRLSTGRNVTDAGLPHLHDIPAFKRWLGEPITYSLVGFNAGPTFLLLDGPFTDRGFSALNGLDGLFGLTFFWHAKTITSAALASLAGAANLGFLGCQDALCDDRAMQHIANIPKLRMLMGQGAVAGDEGWEALSRSQTIEHIWGRENPNLGSRGFAALASMPSLEGLAVELTRVDDAALALLPHFPALRKLVTMGLNDDGFRHVGACDRIEDLTCMYCRDTGDAATAHLQYMTRLKSYYAGATQITDASCVTLGAITSLEKIELWETQGVTNAGIAALAGLPRLRELSLGGLANVTRSAAAGFRPGVRVSIS